MTIGVAVLGSTGSIGTSTLKVAEDLPDQIQLVGLGAGNNVELLVEQTRRHRPPAISLSDPAKAQALQDAFGTTTRVYSGPEGLIKLATMRRRHASMARLPATRTTHASA